MKTAKEVKQDFFSKTIKEWKDTFQNNQEEIQEAIDVYIELRKLYESKDTNLLGWFFFAFYGMGGRLKKEKKRRFIEYFDKNTGESADVKEIVNEINGDKESSAYFSFVTKMLNLKNESVYPIYDSRIAQKVFCCDKKSEMDLVSKEICYKRIKELYDSINDQDDSIVVFKEMFPKSKRVTPKELRKNNYRVPTARNLYFTIFQTMMTSPNAQKAEEQGITLPAGSNDQPYYMQYERNFFDFIIIDECHRGGANDESEWRKLMEYFDSAYQLGMTATPRRKDNANTYAYFGEPVYTYSLKQGIEDGFLVPFRVDEATSNIDDYKYEEGDIVKSGEIDPERVYSESDFYNGRIQIKERDEHRVQELLSKIDPDEKTIIFCATQKHAMIVRDMVHKHKRRPANNYCERVTADDGEVGEATLRAFQDNEKLLPTILTTSYKLSTGVDARNVRNIVLMRPVRNIVEFKQIIGRGTRLFDKKYYFTIYDFTGACEMFKDPDWDGDQYCTVCGNWPCTCKKQPPREPKPCPKCGQTPCVCLPEPCPVCGNLPCTCEAPQTNLIDIKLSDGRRLSLETTWEQKIFFGDEFITLDEYVKKLFGRIPDFFSDADDLREKWANPETREQLLRTLDEAGFAEEKLLLLKNMLKMQRCDLLDVLEYIAYDSTPIERAKRVELVKKQYVDMLNKEQRDFDNLILQYYACNGFKELGTDNLKTFISIKFNSMSDAKERLQMSVAGMRAHYFELQRRLYSPCELTGGQSPRFRKTGKVNITVNINKFEKPVGAVIQTGGTQDLNDIIDMKTE